jgi:Spy/CpxP family protein refolding chaperone
MKLNSRIIAGAAAALSLALAGAVYAHPGDGMWGMGSGTGMGMGMGPGMGRMGFGMGGSSDMTAAAVGRAAELKHLLKITPPQETAWKAFESAIVQEATKLQTMRIQMQAQMQNQAPGSAEWLTQRDAIIKQHDASRASHAAALKDLYAVLTPEQRAVADRSALDQAGPHSRRTFAPR